MRQDRAEDLASSIVAFARFLSAHGISRDLGRTMTALEAARVINIAHRQTFAAALQAALCATAEEWTLFPQLFDEFWRESQTRSTAASEREKPSSGKPAEGQTGQGAVFRDQCTSKAAEPGGHAKAVYGASAQHRLKKLDFSEVSFDDQGAIEDLSLRLLRRMSLRLSRRLAVNNLADRIDLRRSIRQNIGHGGEPLEVVYRGRRQTKNRLVIILDISGSMNFYSLFFVRFAYALQARLRRVHTFLFSTDLVEISDLLRTRRLTEALQGLSQRAAGWSGGTKIGESLRQFNRLFGKTVLSRHTVFIVLSDGWDTGEPELLAAQMAALKRSVQKILWLNPLIGLKDYQPITRGMAAALPYIDVFAPAHNLESLLALERHL